MLLLALHHCALVMDTLNSKAPIQPNQYQTKKSFGHTRVLHTTITICTYFV